MDYDAVYSLFNPMGPDLVAMGEMLRKNPDAVVPQLAAAGVSPPDTSAWNSPFAPHNLLRGMFGGGAPAPASMQPAGPPLGGFSPQPDPALSGGITPQNLGGYPPGPSVALPSAMTPITRRTPSGQEMTEMIPKSPERAGGDESKKDQSRVDDPFLKALSGVRAPTAPQPQRVFSPNAPRPAAIPTQSMLMSLLQQVLGEKAQASQGPRLSQTVGWR